MVKVGFIVEGDTEVLILNSKMFRTFLAKNKYSLVSPVINAHSKSKLLPQNTKHYVATLKSKGATQIYVLADLDEDKQAQDTVQRIKTDEIKEVFVAIKAIEAWFLADTSALSEWLNAKNLKPFSNPENTSSMPIDDLSHLAKQYGKDRINKARIIKVAESLLSKGFSIENAAQHPNCPSAKRLVDHFKPPKHAKNRNFKQSISKV